jgi:hypothetical protein
VEGPVISDLRFNDAPLSANATFTTAGVLSAQVSDPIGVQAVTVKVGAVAMAGGFSGARYLASLNFDSLVDGDYTLTITATDNAGNPSTTSVPVHVAIPPPAAPVIAAPTDGTTTAQPGVGVSGTAPAGSSVQLFVDDVSAGAPVLTANSGSFAATVTLGSEGTHAISAQASNSRGSSARSAAVFVNYSAPVPSVLITAPPANAVVGDAGADINASVIDAIGVSQVEFFVGSQSLGVRSVQPYSVHWPVTSADDGPHTLRVKATNVVGKFAEATYMIGLVKDRCGKTEEALKAYNDALQIDPKLCGARVGTGIHDFKAGREAQAFSTFERSVRDDSRCTEGYVNLAMMQMAHKTHGKLA